MAVTAQDKPAQQAAWCLASFSGHLAGPGILAALPPHSLIHLDLNLLDRYSSSAEAAALSDMLRRLSSLQQLCLGRPYGEASIASGAGNCLAGIVHLSRLTLLKLHGTWPDIRQPLQQLLAQPLPLQQLDLNLADGSQLPVNLAALTQLQELSTSCKLPSGVQFPRSLRLPHCQDGDSLATAVMPLRQLTYLSLSVRFQQCQPLLQLARLPALQHLGLTYHDTADAAATATAWPQLPQLRNLLIINCSDPPTQQHIAELLPALAAASSITNLAWDDHWEDEAAVAMCPSLVRMIKLEELVLSTAMVPGDALALTALTKLTSLILHCGNGGVDNFVATALACSLKQLRHLDLSYCSMDSMVCLAAIAHLTQLTVLRLWGNSGLTKRGLMALTGLSDLQELSVTNNEEVTDEVVEEFWAAVKQQRQQH
jgi:hypothetical protein